MERNRLQVVSMAIIERQSSLNCVQIHAFIVRRDESQKEHLLWFVCMSWAIVREALLSRKSIREWAERSGEPIELVSLHLSVSSRFPLRCAYF